MLALLPNPSIISLFDDLHEVAETSDELLHTPLLDEELPNNFLNFLRDLSELSDHSAGNKREMIGLEKSLRIETELPYPSEPESQPESQPETDYLFHPLE